MVLSTTLTKFKIQLAFYCVPATRSLNSFPGNVNMTYLSINGP
jgi:hypothetical protein